MAREDQKVLPIGTIGSRELPQARCRRGKAQQIVLQATTSATWITTASFIALRHLRIRLPSSPTDVRPHSSDSLNPLNHARSRARSLAPIDPAR
jgi:hypothetical protein